MKRLCMFAHASSALLGPSPSPSCLARSRPAAELVFPSSPPPPPPPRCAVATAAAAASPSASSSSDAPTEVEDASSPAAAPPMIERSRRFVDGPTPETKPDYDNIHGPLGKVLDDAFMSLFRTRLAERVGVDSSLPKNDYRGLMEVVAAMNARYSDRREVQSIAQDTLRSLFPSWLPGRFAATFSGPFPEFSSKLNAWATAAAGTWLMGECVVNDCEVDGGGVGISQGVLVKRCRFLEESGCASVCVNGCKVPTQDFFAEDMGLPLTMTPDYGTGACQFSFGLTPTAGGEADARDTPCLSRCPTAGGLRMWHDGRGRGGGEVGAPRCSLMDDER